MAKLFFYKVKEHAWIIVVALIIAFVLLVILGYALGPDKTFRPPAQRQTEPR